MKKQNKLCLNQFWGNKSPGSGRRLLEALTAPTFRPADTGVRRQSLTRWDSDGLIQTSRNQAAGWRYFSALELIWLRAVLDLRHTGMSFELIRKVRKKLFEPFSPNQWKRPGSKGPQRFLSEGLSWFCSSTNQAIVKSGGISFLLGLLACSVALKSPLVLRIFPQAQILPELNLSRRHLGPEELELLERGCFISLSLTSSMTRFLFSSPPVFDKVPSYGLCQTDRQILDLVHSANLKSIRISFKRGKPKKARLVRIHSADTSLESLPSPGIDEFRLRHRGGKISSIESQQTFLFDSTHLFPNAPQ